MKSRPLAIFALAGLISLGLPLTASADTPASAFRWDSGAVLATDRLFRGQRQTNDKPAVSGEVKLSHDSGAYAGIWAGNLDLGPGTDTHAEFDYFAGWGQRYGKWSVNTGYLYRQRPSNTMSLDFQEATASVAYDFGAVRPGIGVYYSWDYFQGGTSTYSYANLRVPVATVQGVQLIGIATAGHYDFSNGAIGDYDDMDLRLIAKRGSWEYSIGYSDTDVRASHSGLLTRDNAGARLRAQVLVMF
jgi:uncharacterized protein (TIGR02001 family)